MQAVDGPGAWWLELPVTAHASVQLRTRSLMMLTRVEFQKNPVDGFSAGLVDDDNILEWSIVIMGYVQWFAKP